MHCIAYFIYVRYRKVNLCYSAGEKQDQMVESAENR